MAADDKLGELVGVKVGDLPLYTVDDDLLLECLVGPHLVDGPSPILLLLAMPLVSGSHTKISRSFSTVVASASSLSMKSVYSTMFNGVGSSSASVAVPKSSSERVRERG
jgi:hypothetical protein